MVPRYIGLDLHARYVHGCEWKPEEAPGHKERHFRFPNTPDGWAQLLPELGSHLLGALEVTGSAFEVQDVLSPHVDRVLLANPVDLKRLGSGLHTDRVDAARFAKMLSRGHASYRLGAVPANARGTPRRVLAQPPAGVTRRRAPRARGTEGMMSRRRRLVST
jgi:hypothetical protein